MNSGARTSLALLSLSVVGVLGSLVIWAAVGWVDALACYVGTIAGLGLLLSRLAGPALVPPLRQSTGDQPDCADGEPGLSLAESLDPQAGLRRLGG